MSYVCVEKPKKVIIQFSDAACHRLSTSIHKRTIRSVKRSLIKQKLLLK